MHTDIAALVSSWPAALAPGEQDAYRESDEPGAGSYMTAVAEEVLAAVRDNQEHATQSAVAAATEAREHGSADEVAARLGGMFSMTRATQHHFAGSALAEVESALGEAERELDEEIEAFCREAVVSDLGGAPAAGG